VILEKVMTDEQVSPGDRIVTSGGDQIFPKGITVGTVMKVSPGADLFLNIRVKPSASLSRLEEVLVITKKEDRPPSVADSNSVRAVDILTQRLPSVPDKPAADAAPAPEATKPAAAAPKPQGQAAVNSPAGPSTGQGGVKPATSPTAVPPKKASPTAKPAASAPAPRGSQPASSQPSTGDQPH
jgi:rod shape-determining protein MreC